MAHTYGIESSYILSKKSFYNKRWFFLMGLFIVVLVIYTSNLKAILDLPLLIGYAIPLLFLGFIKFTGKFIDLNEIGSRKARMGLTGEMEVFKALQKLPDTYSVLRGLQINTPYDIDFIVVGPSGVFTVEAKSHKGTIGFNGNELTHNRFPFSEKNILKQAMTQAWNVHDYLLRSTGQDIFVKPIIVFTKARAHFGTKLVNNVSVIQIQWLEDVITNSTQEGFDSAQVTESLISLIKSDDNI